jgi:hypothetical protein
MSNKRKRRRTEPMPVGAEAVELRGGKVQIVHRRAPLSIRPGGSPNAMVASIRDSRRGLA